MKKVTDGVVEVKKTKRKPLSTVGISFKPYSLVMMNGTNVIAMGSFIDKNTFCARYPMKPFITFDQEGTTSISLMRYDQFSDAPIFFFRAGDIQTISPMSVLIAERYLDACKKYNQMCATPALDPMPDEVGEEGPPEPVKVDTKPKLH